MAARRIPRDAAQKMAKIEAKCAALAAEKDALAAEKDALAAENAALKAASDLDGVLWNSDNDRHGRRPPTLAHAKEILHMVLHEPELMRKMTLARMDVFEYILERFVEMADADPDAPLFGENDDRTSDPGRRCHLRYDEALLLTLTCMRAKIPQDILEIFFGVDQTTVSRYFNYVRPVLDEILPTPRNLFRAITSAGSREEIEMLVPGMRLLPDGTLVGTRRPSKKEERDPRYGRGKKFSANTVVVANRLKWIVGITETVPGKVPDITLCKELLANFEKSSADLGLAYKIIADKGFQGLADALPESYVRTPVKRGRKRRDGGRRDLTADQKEYNGGVAAQRIGAEHGIGMLKRFRAVSGVHEGTLGELNDNINTVAGLVNLDLMGVKKFMRLRDIFRIGT